MVDGSIASRRPLAVGAVLDGGVRLFRESLIKCVPYAVIAVIAGQSPALYDVLSGRPLRGFPARDPLWWAIYAVATAVLLTMWSALVLRQIRIAAGQPLDARLELRAAARALPALAALVVLGTGAAVLGTLLLVVPGVYLLVVLLMSAPLLLIERRGPWSAFVGARALLAGAWWRTASLIALAALVTLLALLVCFAIGNVIAGIASASLARVTGVIGSVASGVLAVLFGALALLLWTALLLAVYRDLINKGTT
jgi:hypothetical protein